MSASPHDFNKKMEFFLDLHRSYLFRIYLFNTGINIASTAQAILITNLISQSAVPSSRSDEISIGWEGTNVKIAGKRTYGDWKCTIRSDHLNVATNYFSKWSRQIYDYETGSSKFINNAFRGGYKKTALVRLLGSGNVLDSMVGYKEYMLYGVWPKEIGEMTLDYTSETVLTFPVTFSVDYWIESSFLDI